MHEPNFLAISSALKFHIIVWLLLSLMQKKKSEVVKISQHLCCGNQYSSVSSHYIVTQHLLKVTSPKFTYLSQNF